MASRQRLAGRVDGGASEERGFESKGMAEALRDRAERPHGLGGDLAADAVAREDGDQSLQLEAPPHGFVALDLGQLAAQIAELIEPIEQAMARKRLDRKIHGDSGRAA